MKSSSLFFFFLLFSQASFSQQKLNFGRYKSRAIFTPTTSEFCPAPIVILIPGSGPNGPEEMIPASLTGNNQDVALLSQFALGLQNGHVNTLAIGKPGIDFFSSWNTKDIYYDSPLFKKIKWIDLVLNVKDAVALAKTLPCVDQNNVTLLGHSEGTQLAVDFAFENPNLIQNLILVGYSGENLRTTLNWQFYRREIDSWLISDVDKNHNGLISRTEAMNWPELKWDWKENQSEFSLTEYENLLRKDPNLNSYFSSLSSSIMWQDIIDREPIYERTASLTQNVFIFTGSLDVQTRPTEALNARSACQRANKKNCKVFIIDGLGHGMSIPRKPRQQKLLDMTLGPVENSFLKTLEQTAQQLK